jgi:hypothetical protein
VPSPIEQTYAAISGGRSSRGGGGGTLDAATSAILQTLQSPGSLVAAVQYIGQIHDSDSATAADVAAVFAVFDGCPARAPEPISNSTAPASATPAIHPRLLSKRCCMLMTISF